MATRTIGRSATSGQFISVADAERRPATSVIETIDVPARPLRRRRRRAARPPARRTKPRTFKAGKDL